MKREASRRPAGENVQIFKYALYSCLTISLLISLVCVPCWVTLVSDIYGNAYPQDGAVIYNPWSYSIVAGGQIAHLLLLFFGLSAAYDESFIKSAIFSLTMVMVTIGLFLVCEYVHVIVTIMIEFILSVVFGWFSFYLRREQLYDGRTTPLL
ncbi:hypothetical protein HDE_04875 [Halotydeus destructor]|nr:hypothetical protein HDE_04875 [Halotydeus destructor]